MFVGIVKDTMETISTASLVMGVDDLLTGQIHFRSSFSIYCFLSAYIFKKNDSKHATIQSIETPRMRELVEYEISTDRQRLDVTAVHAFLTQSYWSPGISRSVVERAIANSMCFGVFLGAEQVGFARVVTDKATFAYLADVFITEPHRGKGLSKRLMEYIISREELQGLRRFILGTSDAHNLYAKYGFAPLSNPSKIMEIFKPDVYLRSS